MTETLRPRTPFHPLPHTSFSIPSRTTSHSHSDPPRSRSYQRTATPRYASNPLPSSIPLPFNQSTSTLSSHSSLHSINDNFHFTATGGAGGGKTPKMPQVHMPPPPPLSKFSYEYSFKTPRPSSTTPLPSYEYDRGVGVGLGGGIERGKTPPPPAFAPAPSFDDLPPPPPLTIPNPKTPRARPKTPHPHHPPQPASSHPQSQSKSNQVGGGGGLPAVGGGAPHEHLASTMAWIAEQELLEKAKKDRETRKWIYEQTHGNGGARVRAFQAHEDPSGREWIDADGFGELGEKDEVDVRSWGDNVKYGFGYPYPYSYPSPDPYTGYYTGQAYEVHEQAERWMREEEEKRKERARREKERAERVREEMRRIEERVQRKVEDAKRKILEQRQQRIDTRERRERERAEKAWKSYESRWNAILNPSGSTSSLISLDEDLEFSNIPWPTFSKPRSPSSLTGLEIASFFLCPHHSVGVSNKDRIRAGLRLYHPDRFRKIAGRVKANEKSAVDEGVGIVARVLNDLLARECRT